MYGKLKDLIAEAHDVSLTKPIMCYLLTAATPRTSIKILPRIDFESYEDVCRMLLEQPTAAQRDLQPGVDSEQPFINQASIDLLMRVLSERTQFTNDGERVQVEATMRYCDIACSICDPGNALRIMNDAKKFITCVDKKRYCQAALDLYAELPQRAKDEERGSYYLQQLSVINSTLKYQIKVRDAIANKITTIEEARRKFPAAPTTAEIDRKLADLRATSLMETVNYNEKRLVTDFVLKYNLFDLIYEYLSHEICKAAGRPQYSEANQDLLDFVYQIRE